MSAEQCGPGLEAAFPGAVNARDGGGLACQGGFMVTGRLFRSGSPEPAAYDALWSKGVRTVVDLRTPGEVAIAPPPFGGTRIRREAIPIVPGNITQTLQLSLTDAPDLGIGSVGELYRLMLDTNGAELAAAISCVARGLPAGVLVHCAAGKDRTGMVVALIQMTLGVALPDVVAHYAASAARLPAAWRDQLPEAITRHPKAALIVELIVGSPPEAMEAAIDHLEENWGGARPYLSAQGLAPDDVRALREHLVH
ncbi:MAG: tyrosine-protein phosphatase [Bifidobacteriaceae bacterium]|jgi:protein-tyrosine phosphatase|nr:tyrosine-protein phosphatase [Bifidobacteriaceae bacterium]